MLKDFALEMAKKIVKDNPDFILCGSLPLILLGKIPDRFIGDLDFCCNKDDFNNFDHLDKDDKYTIDNGTYVTYKVFIDEQRSIYYNLFVHDKPINIIKSDFGVVFQDTEDILNWKKSYNRPKDLADLGLHETIRISEDLPF